MEPRKEKTISKKARDSGRGISRKNSVLKAKMDELTMTKDELKKAKDTAMQSWLDSKPLLDELEKVKAALATAHKRSSMSTIVISELEVQLETTNLTIRAKKQQELEATRTIDQLTQAIERGTGDREALELHIDERRRLRSKLKQLLRVRRQTHRALSLALHATRAEMEAATVAAEEAKQHIEHTEKTKETVQLTHEEYRALKRRAREETLLAEQRVSEAGEQRAAAEASRHKALTRKYTREVALASAPAALVEQDVDVRPEAEEGAEDAIEGPVLPKAWVRAGARITVESNRVGTARGMRGARTGGKRKILKKKKKPSIFQQIKSFIVRTINRLFG
ncbi:uncharacterized protein LOC116199017 [Punica granatum]|uniref:Uncharacterized protein LOC116199017 n=1 Tax=Punica granatum TaxID=22663 RepID=A0A218W106_PUNGR|nr:uncharacterized protein LOC116199017 [Punica granatum]OWM66233.1 hypothetical protein CDL15_Pgr013450 [Punica granatum]